MEQNAITIRGCLQDFPCISHENHGRKFYQFHVDVSRLSGTVDTIPVIAEERVLGALDPCGGDMLLISGQIRSHNERINGIRHLKVFLFAASIAADEGEPINDVHLTGILCREPTYRCTPLGRQICDAMLAVPRSYHRADYLPCIFWGRIAQDISRCHTKDQVEVYGRLQSRSYNKQYPDGTCKTLTTYEISALSAEPIPQDI